MSKLPRVLKVIADILFYFLIVVLAGTVVLGILTAFKTEVNGRLSVPVALTPDSAAVRLSSDALGSAELGVLAGTATFESGGAPGDVARVLLAIAVFLLAVLWMVHLLRRIFGSIAAGQPFSEDNRRRIRAIGLLVIAAEFVGQSVVFLLQQSVASSTVATGAELSAVFSVNPTTVLLGLLIVALAEAFRRGADLQAESDLTV